MKKFRSFWQPRNFLPVKISDNKVGCWINAQKLYIWVLFLVNENFAKFHENDVNVKLDFIYFITNSYIL